ncbi:MAG: uroporphyrinogen-III synthase [Bacteroidaceae bacterium]|nr:uroporphyrinogen-III synthase [Bacteroidaceae bacterium]
MIKKILVSQPRPTTEKSPYFEIAKKHNVELVFHPFIRVEGLTPKEFRTQKVNVLDHTAIVFTSRHAIDHFFMLCKEMRVAIPEDMKYFAVSEAISLYIQKYVQYRKRKVFFPATGKFVDLLPLMVKHKVENYLVPLSDVHNDEVKNMMDAHNLKHTECIMYRTVANDYPKELPFDFDLVVLFTPAGVQSLIKNVPDIKDRNIRLVSYGKATSAAMSEAGLPMHLEAPTPQAPSITGSLDLYLSKENA